jgi:hypothetical protein
MTNRLLAPVLDLVMAVLAERLSRLDKKALMCTTVRGMALGAAALGSGFMDDG